MIQSVMFSKVTKRIQENSYQLAIVNLRHTDRCPGCQVKKASIIRMSHKMLLSSKTYFTSLPQGHASVSPHSTKRYTNPNSA